MNSKNELMGDVNKKTLVELEEMLCRQEKLLKNKRLLSTLSDKGEKIRNSANVIKEALEKRRELESVEKMLTNLSIRNSGVELDSDDDEFLDEVTSSSGSGGGNHVVGKLEEKFKSAVPDRKFQPGKTMNSSDLRTVTRKLGEKGVTSKAGKKSEGTWRREDSAVYWPDGSNRAVRTLNLEESLKAAEDYTRKLRDASVSLLAEKSGVRMGGGFSIRPSESMNYRDNADDPDSSEDDFELD